MKYLELSTTDPYWNLALEAYVFTHMDPDESYFLLWQIENSILIGKHQNTIEEINQEFVDAHHIHVLRRLTGGGAVYHDMGNLNFSFIVRQNTENSYNFRFFVEPVLEVLHSLGVPAEFTGRNDLTIHGLKFSGNAQCAWHGRLLHHGCLMLDANVDYLSEALRVKKVKYESRGIKSVHSRVTCINDHLEQKLTMEEFKKKLRDAVLSREDVQPLTLREEDYRGIRKIRDEQFATWEWNYGRSPSYNLKRERKFPAGLVTAYLQVQAGHIQSVRFFGDFFGNQNLSQREQAMRHLPLDNQLPVLLARLHPERYMKGIAADEVASLILNE